MQTNNTTDAAHEADIIAPINNTNVKKTDAINDTNGKPMGAENDRPLSVVTLDEPFKNVPLAPTTKAVPRDNQSQYPVVGEKMQMVTPLERLGEEPAFIDCPHCEKRTSTKVEKIDSSQTSLAAAFCCLCCGVITVCIPFLCHWCADIDHRCSECGKQVSHQPHDGPVQARYPQGPVQAPSKYIDK